MTRAALVLLIAVAALSCGGAPAPVDPCEGRPRSDYAELWSRPRPHPEGTMWNVTFLLPPCSWRTVRDTVLFCAAVNTTRCVPKGLDASAPGAP